jgi:hypothetical protein
MSRVILVACVAGKKARAVRAAELYTSAWFTKARALVEASGEPWFILSAEHGLLAPDMVVGPYERTLNAIPASERRNWAVRVQRQMEEHLPAADEVIILAGKRYREHLLGFLRKRFAKVTLPMEGLTIGRQLNWLDNAASL